MVEYWLSGHETAGLIPSTTCLSICVHACDPGILEVPFDGSEVKAYLATLKAQQSQPRIHEILSQNQKQTSNSPPKICFIKIFLLHLKLILLNFSLFPEDLGAP